MLGICMFVCTVESSCAVLTILCCAGGFDHFKNHHQRHQPKQVGYKCAEEREVQTQGSVYYYIAKMQRGKLHYNQIWNDLEMGSSSPPSITNLGSLQALSLSLLWCRKAPRTSLRTTVHRVRRWLPFGNLEKVHPQFELLEFPNSSNGAVPFRPWVR